MTPGTVGYGNAVPITSLGKLVGAMSMLWGLVMIALPVGIIATAFSEQIHRRDFVVTWGMVARVPLFAGLDAAAIADIMRLLRAQTVEAGELIVRRGDKCPFHVFSSPAGRSTSTSMASISDSALAISLARSLCCVEHLRSTTVAAITSTNLLVLDASDFHELLEQEPRIAARIDAVVRDRVGREVVSPRGDIVAGELEAATEKP